MLLLKIAAWLCNVADVCIFLKTHCDLVGDSYHTPVPSPKLETKASAEIENISGTPLPGKLSNC